ncbi:MAG: hypothetical protein WBI63_09970 [Coriobacteriia bacterium]
MRVWCKYCREYPARSRQGNRCIVVSSDRSIDSRPCEPRLTLAGRIRKLCGLKIG